MFTALVRSSRCIVAGAFASLLLLSSFGSLHGQVAASSIAMVQTANSRLTAEAQSGLPLTTESRSMLVARHAALVTVFENAPTTARSYALPAATREKLLAENPAYAALIEQETTVTGQLISRIEDSFKTHSSRKVYSLYTATGAIRLSFTNPAANLAAIENRTVTVAGLGFPEVVAADSVRMATRAEMESSIPSVPTSSRLIRSAASTNATPPFTGPGITSTAPPIAMVTGPQSAAVIIVDFATTPMDTNGNPPSNSPLTLQSDFNTQAYYNKILNPGSIPNVSDYIAETSYGKASYAADVYGPFVLPSGYNCAQTDAMIAAALQAAVNAGLDTSKYNRFVFPYPTTACTYDGLASSGPTTPLINHEWTWVAFPIQPQEVNTTSGFAQKFLVMSHEFGHNLGLNHSNTIDFGPLALGPIDFVATNPGTVDPGGPSHPAALENAVTPAAVGSPITGINDEYGDPYPIMAGVGYTPYNAEHRNSILGWIGTDGEQDVTASGTFSIAPTENTTGLRALHVLRDAVSNSWVWVEFHQPNSTYTNFGIPYLVMPNTLTTGAELLYSTSYLDSLHTYLIDTTPSAKPNNFADATLANGLSWSDPYSLLTITSGSQTNSALGVTVSYDTACATPVLSASSVTAAAGTGTVTVTAAAGCAWTVSSNASWITIPTASGTGNGSASFTYTANSSTVERRTYLTTARQSLPLLQQGTAVNVLNVTPKNIAVAPGVFTPIAFHINNAGGAGANASFYIAVNSLSPITGLKTCYIGAEPQPGNDPSNYGIFTFGSGDSIIGSSGTVTIGACTIDLSNSTFTSSGSTATLTLSISFPVGFTGSHPITVSNDNLNYLNMGYVNVGKPSVAYTTASTLTATPPTITNTGSTMLQAAVSSFSGTTAGPVPDGVFSFTSGSINLGTCDLVGGTCSIMVSGSTLQTGTQNIVATYLGNGTYPSSSASASVTVTNLSSSTSTVLSASPASPVNAGTAVTLSAAVTTTTTPAPVAAGQVNFYDGSISPATLIGSAELMPSGIATLTTIPTIGVHNFIAQFQGTTAFPAKTTSEYPFTVTAAGTYNTTQSLTSSGSSPYTLTDIATFYGQAIPGGMINFRDTTTGTVLGSFTPTPLTQTLAAPTTFASGTNAKGIPSSIVGDFNNDGIPDIATTNVFDTTVSVMLGKPDGSYKAAQTFGTGSAPYGIAVGDFDGDGNLDLVTSNLSDNTVSVLLGKGNGSFKVEKLFVVGHDPYSVNAADVDGDGILDLVVTDLDDKTISVLIGKGNGDFKAQKTYATGTQPIAAAIADFNGDGKLDVAVANVSDNTVGLLLGNGDGTFQAMTTFATGQSPYSIRTADFNQDGKPDLVVTNAFSNSVGILLNAGGGTFSPQVTYATGTTPTAVVTLNYDGTGHQSLAVANYADNTLGILVGKGDGTFLPQVTFPTITAPYQLAVGDLNVDGKQDLVVGNFGTNQIGTQLGTQTAIVTLSGVTGGHTITAVYNPSTGDAYSRSTSPTTVTTTATPVVKKTAK